ncbi:Nucleoid occlusion protein [subsurface metagenome]
MAAKKKDLVKMVEMGLIDEPEGVIRLEIDPDKIIELSESIKAMGQLQPILIRPKGERYEIVYGHRRFMAVQRIGKARILATVKELDDQTTALIRATENIEREDITPVEEAAVYVDLVERGGMTIAQISKKMGRSAGIIKRRMDLLRMPECLQKAVHRGQIGYSAAEELWRLGELSDIQYYLGFAIDHGATVEVIRMWVKEKIDERRRANSDIGGGRESLSPMETRPVYVACDICREAMEIGEETVIRSCQKCTKAIKKALEGGE